MSRPARTTARRGLAALAVSGLLSVGLTGMTTSAAHSAPTTDCPDVVGVDQVAAGDAVTGLTVTSGTTPGPFTGTVQGVLEDGIAPGVDMILADLHSTTIDQDGIWEGMSGSPVYDGDGDLIGAVSYSLGTGPSTIAGITPASEMRTLLDDSALGDHRAPARVPLTKALSRRVVAAGAASAAQAAHGLSQLQLPTGISGLSSARLAKLKPVLHVGGHVLDAPAGPVSSEAIPISAGGNMAAAYSYGFVSASGLGTATMVCGNKIIGFGHPMDLAGQRTLSLHGARTILIQGDPTVSGFKVANLGAPIGTVDQDRTVGIRGVTGALPGAATLSSTAFVGNRQSQGTTHVNEQGMLVDLGISHLMGVQDKALDRIGKGRGWATWTIKGTRADGRSFSMSRRDHVADPSDISAAAAIEAVDDLDAIVSNPDEEVTVDSVTMQSHLGDDYQKYAISKVQVRSFGHWVTASRDEPTPVHAGYVVPMRVTLTSREAAPRVVHVAIRVPAKAANHLGSLRVLGGMYDEDSDEFFDEGDVFFRQSAAPSASAFPKLIASLEGQQQQNEIATTMRFRASGAAGKRLVRSSKLSDVVSGDKSFPLYALR